MSTCQKCGKEVSGDVTNRACGHNDSPVIHQMKAHCVGRGGVKQSLFAQIIGIVKSLAKK
jgi:hypothetical protein